MFVGDVSIKESEIVTGQKSKGAIRAINGAINNFLTHSDLE